jgi:hypothetical protein
MLAAQRGSAIGAKLGTETSAGVSVAIKQAAIYRGHGLEPSIVPARFLVLHNLWCKSRNLVKPPDCLKVV